MSFRNGSSLRRDASSGIWLRSRPGLQLADRHRIPRSSSAHPRPMSGGASAAPSERCLRRNEVHRRRQQGRRVRRAGNPRVDHIGPFLQHVAALLAVFRLVGITLVCGTLSIGGPQTSAPRLPHPQYPNYKPLSDRPQFRKKTLRRRNRSNRRSAIAVIPNSWTSEVIVESSA